MLSLGGSSSAGYRGTNGAVVSIEVLAAQDATPRCIPSRCSTAGPPAPVVAVGSAMAQGRAHIIVEEDAPRKRPTAPLAMDELGVPLRPLQLLQAWYHELGRDDAMKGGGEGLESGLKEPRPSVDSIRCTRVDNLGELLEITWLPSTLLLL